MTAFWLKPLTTEPHTFWVKQQSEKPRDAIVLPALPICFLRKGSVLRDSTEYSLSLTGYTYAWPLKLSDTANDMCFIRSRCRLSLVSELFHCL